MMAMVVYILPAFVAGVGIVICQLAGVPWWINLFAGGTEPTFYASLIGWAISLSWEAASVWGWLARRPAVAVLATVMLMVGMVGHGTERLIKETDKEQIQLTSLEEKADILNAAVNREISAAHSNQRTAEKQVASGWAGLAGRSQRDARAQLRQARNLDDQRISIVEQLGSLVRANWIDTVRPWSTLVIFPALYFIVIRALVFLRTFPNDTREYDSKKARESLVELRSRHSDSRVNGKTNTRERAIVITYAKSHKLTSQAAVAREIGVSPPRLSEYVTGTSGTENHAEITAKLKE